MSFSCSRDSSIRKLVETLRVRGQAIGIDSEALQRLEQKLDRCDAQYQSLFNSIAEGFALCEIICDSEGEPYDYCYLEVNPALEKLTGIKADELVGRRIRELLPTVDAEWIRILGRVALTGAPVRFQTYCKHLDKWLEVSAFSPTKGQCAHLLVDITERKREEMALHENQERLALAQRAGHVGVFDWDIVSGRVAWTPEQEELFGIPVGSFENTYVGWARRVHPEDITRLTPFFEQWLQSSREREQWEYRFIRPDGQFRWMLGRGQVIRNSIGKPVRMIGTNVDITDRKQVEEALWQSRQMLLRLVLDSIPVRVFWKDRDSVYQGCNQPFAQDAGLHSVEQVRGKTDVDIGFPEAEKYRADDREVMESGQEKINFEEQQTTPGEEPRWVRTNKVPLRDPQGDVIGVLGTYEDITERKRIEQERIELLHREQKARAEAEVANARKDQFLAVLSHELRTPLTPVLARLELLRRQPSLPPEVASAVEMIRRNVELEVRVIDDLLDLSKVAHGKLQLNFQVVDAHQAIEEAASIHQHEVEAKHLQLTQHLAAERHHVRADPVRLRQIFWNLISNAVKFTPPGGRISISTANQDNQLKVEVADNGIGIDPQIMPRLFKAFEQGEQTLTRRYGGLGLGLSITKSLVNLHGGCITAHSEGRQKGATFTIQLQAIECPAAAPPSPPPPALGRRKQSLKILLVEDNEDTQRVLARLLRSLGHQVKTSTTAKSALELATAEQFDLLLSDIGLPDATGWELMRNLRSRRPIAGIAFSGFGQEEDIHRSHEVGFLAHLIKPIDMSTLERALQQVMAT